MATSKILTDINVDGDVTADSFIKDGGTSSQFLKADGTVDSTSYSTAPNNAEANVQSDWNATSGDAFILNKPTIINDTGTPAILSNGSTPSLNSGITAAEVRTLIGAGDSSYSHTEHGAKIINTSGSWIFSKLTTDIYGHVSVAGIRNLTLNDLGFTGDTNANYSTNNVTTNLTTTHNQSNVVVNSSDGTNATINGATATTAGVVTNGTQTIAGEKTFEDHITVNGNFEANGTLDVFNSSGVYQFQKIDPATAQVTIGDMDDLSYGTQIKVEGNTGNVKFFTSTTENMRLTNASVLHVDGDVIAFSATISDERLKENVETIKNASDTVNKLRGVSYTWKEGKRKGEAEIGLIAQEVEKVLPCLVKEHELPITEGAVEGEIYKTVDYEKLVGLLIEDSKEKDETIQALLRRVEKLENTVTELKYK